VAAGFAAGAVEAGGVGVEAGAVAVVAAGVVAGGALGVGFTSGAAVAGGVAAAGAEASAAAGVFDLEDFFGVVASLAAGAATAVFAVPDFLLLVDFAAVELPLAAVVESADAPAFFDFDDLFVVEESAGVEVPAASGFFDLEDFFAVELSASGVASAVSVFLLLVDFLVLEESAAAVSSGVAGFFFFLGFAALVSLWSAGAGVCAAWPADAGRRVRLANTSRTVAIRATGKRLRVRFIVGEFLSPAADQALCLVRG